MFLTSFVFLSKVMWIISSNADKFELTRSEVDGP